MTVSSEGGQWTSFVPLTAMHWSSWRKMKILWHFERKQQFDLLVKCNKIPLCFSLKTYMLANMCATCNFPMKTYSTTSVLDSTDFNLFFLHFFCYIVFFFPGVYFLVSAKTIHAHVLQGTNWLFESPTLDGSSVYHTANAKKQETSICVMIVVKSSLNRVVTFLRKTKKNVKIKSHILKAIFGEIWCL